MSKEAQNKNIYQRILGIMSDVSYIQKDEKKVANQYRYVSHDSVSAVIHPMLVKHGIVVIPTVKEMLQDGNRTTMCLMITFINSDNPNESICVESYGYGIDTADKGPGKAYSYAFKYALLKMFCLETGDDPDHDQDAKYKPSNCISEEQLEMIQEYDVPELKDFKQQVLKYRKIKGYDELLAKDFDAFFAKLKEVYEQRTSK